MKTPSFSNCYTGIGSRKITSDMSSQLQELGRLCSIAGLTLRSGGAHGSDSAFEQGCDRVQGNKEIYLPWTRMNGHSSTYTSPAPEAYNVASTIHPKWDSLSQGARSMHARNIHQILGPDLDDPTNFVLCWTPDGAETIDKCTKDTGGTATAIKLACFLDITVINLRNRFGCDQALEVISQYIDHLDKISLHPS